APLTAALVKGVLERFHDGVNSVNALPIARSSGIRVTETRSTAPTDFASLVSVRLKSDRGSTSVGGTVYNRQEPRVVDIDGFRLEAVPEGHLLVFSNLDVPGVIGFMGTLLGKHNVNIAGMALGRRERGGRAVSVVNVDDAVPPEVLAEIRQMPNIVYAKLVRV
ncbi:MAG TPA: ACT domain-containing protein, partial [Candidatus Sulfotelmatobacter sp.]|nr:ACT domain-containing protein [Candidatus Sulfotelmatobacter sp.]